MLLKKEVIVEEHRGGSGGCETRLICLDECRGDGIEQESPEVRKRVRFRNGRSKDSDKSRFIPGKICREGGPSERREWRSSRP